MKVRLGFVSNSSSSSFLIYGTAISKDTAVIREALLSSKEKSQKFLEYTNKYDKEFVFDQDNWQDQIKDLFEDTDDVEYEIFEAYAETCLGGLGYWMPCDYDKMYVGKSWDQIRDDETGKQFKESIEASIRECFGPDVKCSTIEEAWTDC